VNGPCGWTTSSKPPPLVTQLCFEGDPYLDSDCAEGVKQGLIIPLSKTEADGDSWTHGEFAFVLQPQ
jgi:hypothetical protein